MALGKAFIEVHADTKPFARELGRELGRILATVEKTVVAKQSEQIGEKISASVGDGIRRNKTKTTAALGETLKDSTGLFETFGKGIIDTIDDGLSGLPAELKLAIGVALAGTLPLVVSFGASLVAALGTGIASGGTLFAAFQFEEVQDRFTTLVSSLRKTFLGDGRSFLGPVFDAFDMVEDRSADLAPIVSRILTSGSEALGPLVDGLLRFSENFLSGFADSLENADEFAVIIADGIATIGTEFGELFAVITANENSKQALQDLLDLTAFLVDETTGLIDVFLDLYDVTKFLATQFNLLYQLNTLSNGALGQTEILYKDLKVGTDDFALGVRGTLTPLEAEEKALKELAKQMDEYTNATFEALDIEISFEEKLDDLTASLKKNGDELRLTEPAGRANARALQALAKEAIAARDNTLLLTGSQTEAEAVYQAHVAKIYAAGAAYKLTKDEINKLIVGLNSIPAPKLTADTKGFNAAIDASIARIRELNRLMGFRPAEIGSDIRGGYQYKGYADGGIFDSPTVGMFGEAGREVIIPTTKPRRAAELIQQSGLGDMFGSGSTNVNVYIGNQQIDAYIDDRVNRQMSQTARSMSYGSRGN